MGDEVSLTIGVTGHRVLSEFHKIVKGIDIGLARIQPFVLGKSLFVASSLAEGADRLVVKRVLAHFPFTKLVVVLPFEEDEYIKDFATESSKKEFEDLLEIALQISVVSPGPSRKKSYVSACNKILSLSDILFAVWDGKPAQGAGGTAEMVKNFRWQHKRIVWVHAGNRQLGSLTPTTLGKNQGLVTLENFTTNLK